MTTEMINLHTLERKLQLLQEDRDDGIYYVRIFNGAMELVVTKWDDGQDYDIFEALTFEDFNQQLNDYIAQANV